MTPGSGGGLAMRKLSEVRATIAPSEGARISELARLVARHLVRRLGVSFRTLARRRLPLRLEPKSN